MSDAAEFAAWIAPGRTALLIVDMQVDFASPDGAAARDGADLSPVPAALAKAEQVADAARQAGVPVIFVGLCTRPETDSPAWRTLLERSGRDPDQAIAFCRAGSPGAAFYGPRPVPGDSVVWKTGYGGFFGTDLDARLKGLEVDTLVVCGLTTECCVDQTVREGFQRGYQMFVVQDGCTAYDAELHAHTLRVLAANCALLTDGASVCRAWSQRSRTDP